MLKMALRQPQQALERWQEGGNRGRGRSHQGAWTAMTRYFFLFLPSDLERLGVGTCERVVRASRSDNWATPALNLRLAFAVRPVGCSSESISEAEPSVESDDDSKAELDDDIDDDSGDDMAGDSAITVEATGLLDFFVAPPRFAPPVPNDRAKS